ncbi:sugar phosphate isomerase/epimerase family protein [Sunxiuqinia sp. A32]|uniref:sugar phosphate isomerase/epimerase family protein n=1 Tax=Sunxiuqinia sp. A32 TaxID=3461496 RepID=UPI0040464019
MKINRREFIGKSAGVATMATALAFSPKPIRLTMNKNKTNFKYCLNTSTISGQNPGLLKYIDIASKAGYDGIELWVRDVKGYLNQGHTITSLKKYIDERGITVENAIGFATWMVDDDEQRKEAFELMKEEMELMAQLGCRRIAACAKGLSPDDKPDLIKLGERYKEMLDLGRQTGVKPILEFWGHSAFSTLSQAMMVGAVADDPDVQILADVYHMHRGGSGFDGLKMLNGNVIEIFHMNDFVTSIPRGLQTDKDRVYPGDGTAPMTQILSDLSNMGGTKVLSLELFNQEYYKQDAYLVAKTGLEKMKEQVALIH